MAAEACFTLPRKNLVRSYSNARTVCSSFNQKLEKVSKINKKIYIYFLIEYRIK
jgi:hypothetical protein